MIMKTDARKGKKRRAPIPTVENNIAASNARFETPSRIEFSSAPIFGSYNPTRLGSNASGHLHFYAKVCVSLPRRRRQAQCAERAKPNCTNKRIAPKTCVFTRSSMEIPKKDHPPTMYCS